MTGVTAVSEPSARTTLSVALHGCPGPLAVRTVAYPLARANDALADLRAGAFSGAAVLTMQ